MISFFIVTFYNLNLQFFIEWVNIEPSCSISFNWTDLIQIYTIFQQNTGKASYFLIW